MTTAATGQWLVSARGHRWFFDSGALSLDFAYTGDWGYGVPEWERLRGVDDLARWLDERFAEEGDRPLGRSTAADLADALELRAAISTLALLAARLTGAAAAERGDAERADAETSAAAGGSGWGAGGVEVGPAAPLAASSFAEAVAADAPARAAVDALNAFAARPDLAPWLPGGEAPRAPAAASAALASIARDAVSLFAAHAHRIRECEGDTCRLVFVDTSRPGRRRWCSMSRCGGWAKARAHAERERTRAGAPDGASTG